MKRSGIFWGAVVILAGLILLAFNLDIIQFNVWKVLFPAFIILLGLWFLLGPTLFKTEYTTQELALPLQGAAEAQLTLAHGAGRLDVTGAAAPGQLLSGTFAGGVRHIVETLPGGGLKAKVEAPSDILFAFPWGFSHRGLMWTVKLTDEVPLRLKVATGASETSLNLRDLRVTELKIETGASSTQVTLPANAGFTTVKVEAGAASLNLVVPQGVAARIHDKSGLSTVKVDPTRFNRIGGLYESPDYATAANRAEIFLESGLGSFDIR